MDAKYHSVVAQVGDISLLRAENKAYAALIAALLPMAAVKTDEDRKLCEVNVIMDQKMYIYILYK